MSEPPVVYNLGSLNIDRVFRVPHLVRPGETLSAASISEFAGGKGANQSVALARAGVQVVHVGKVGRDGLWLRDQLAAEGIDTSHIAVTDGPTGQAFIQVDDAGQNAIVLLPGANALITTEEIEAALSTARRGDWLLVQNETSGLEHAMKIARDRQLWIAYNPAPLDERVRSPEISMNFLFANEDEMATIDRLGTVEMMGDCEIVVTRGAQGATYRLVVDGSEDFDAQFDVPATPVRVVDTTAAGDTFIGYYIAGSVRDLPPRACLELACRAAGISVTRPGAMPSIPTWDEVAAPAG